MDFDAASALIAEYEAESRSLGEIDHLNTRRTELNSELRINKDKIHDFNVNPDPFSRLFFSLM